MIEAWRYVNDLPDRSPLPLDDLAAAIDPKEALVWVDCADPTDAGARRRRCPAEHPRNAAEDIQHGGQRTKLEHYRDHFHVAVHDCELIDDELVVREVDVVFGEGWLLTVRQAPEDGGATARRSPVEPVARRFERQRFE